MELFIYTRFNPFVNQTGKEGTANCHRLGRPAFGIGFALRAPAVTITFDKPTYRYLILIATWSSSGL
jgi:hypothetical protein